MTPSHKGSISAGNQSSALLFTLLGVIGAFITILGLTRAHAQLYYVAGSSLLLVTALYFKMFYFIALEMILIAGHGAVLLGIGHNLQVALPVLLCIQLLVYYGLSGQLTNWYILTGIAGIATLSIGFVYVNQWIFFIGSTAIAIYAYSHSTTRKIALLWAVLNSVFALIAVLELLQPGLWRFYG